MHLCIVVVSCIILDVFDLNFNEYASGHWFLFLITFLRKSLNLTVSIIIETYWVSFLKKNFIYWLTYSLFDICVICVVERRHYECNYTTWEADVNIDLLINTWLVCFLPKHLFSIQVYAEIRTCVNLWRLNGTALNLFFICKSSRRW